GRVHMCHHRHRYLDTLLALRPDTVQLLTDKAHECTLSLWWHADETVVIDKHRRRTAHLQLLPIRFIGLHTVLHPTALHATPERRGIEVQVFGKINQTLQWRGQAIPLLLAPIEHMMNLPELALFASTPGGLRRHLTRRVQGKRIEHQLHLPRKELHR